MPQSEPFKLKKTGLHLLHLKKRSTWANKDELPIAQNFGLSVNEL